MKKIIISIFLIMNISVQSQDHVVKMLNQGSEGFMVFEPAVLKILPGDSVTFEATDAAHNSASISGMIPEGAKNGMEV
jgi:plastocyanin